jgi:biopolymer transport protein ExbD
MAEVQQQTTGNSKRRSRRPLPAIRVDMTPMVDLAFLLLTFFVLTSELTKENAITMKSPADGNMKVNGLTVFVTQNPENFFWYRGEFDPALHLNGTGKGKNDLLSVLKQANSPVFEQTEIINRQRNLGLLSYAAWKKKSSELAESKQIPFVAVKWDEEASYGAVISVIDMLNRTHNPKYAVVPMTDEDKALVAHQ